MRLAGKGYTSTRLGVFARLNEMCSLFRAYQRGPAARVSHNIVEARRALDDIGIILQKPVENLDVLEIGSGQQSIHLAVMAEKNRALGIDRESAGDRLSVSTLKAIRVDGLVRFVKTIGRKCFGFDRAMRKEYVAQMGVKEWPSLNVQQSDATSMPFADDAFDVVFSRAVFEHLEKPRDVLCEVSRILRPGGVFYCLFHLYTSDSGCHDGRIIANQRSALPYWSHLRECHRDKVIENTYLNKLKLREWKDLFYEILPGVRVDALMDDASVERREALAAIRENGELITYSDEELLTVTVKAVWRSHK